MRLCNLVLPIILSCVLFNTAYSQDSSAYSRLYHLPDKFFDRLTDKSRKIERQLDRQTAKHLSRLQKQEELLRKKLWRKDSSAAKELFGNVPARYAKLKNLSATGSVYSSRLDSMQTALRFLSTSSAGVSNAINEYARLQQQLDLANQLKKHLRERQEFLRNRLGNLGLAKEFRKFKKEVYYYRAQVDEYKNLLEDPSKLEAKLLRLANKIPTFKEFFNKHSMLAGMFRLPGNGPAAPFTPIPGLQTRASVQQDMLQRFGTGPDVSRAMQQNIQSAQAQINRLKEKVQQLGGSNSDMDMPDFKPNSQRTKSFWKRVELGTNMQSTRGNSFFPVTSDIALSAGYKINDRSTAGIGLSYKLGWGQDIRHIKFTHEGIGLRSFLDIKLQGSFYATGGLEYNYQQPFNALQQLRDVDSWHQSGLIGVSKIIAVKSNLFKKTKVQLLWDVLSYRQAPRTQPLKFRIGYNF